MSNTSIYNTILKDIETFNDIEQVRSYLNAKIDNIYYPEYEIRVVGDKKKYTFESILNVDDAKLRNRQISYNSFIDVIGHYYPILSMNPMSLVRYIMEKSQTKKDVMSYFIDKKLSYVISKQMSDIYCVADGQRVIRIGFHYGFFIILMKPYSLTINVTETSLYDIDVQFEHFKKDIDVFKRNEKLNFIISE